MTSAADRLAAAFLRERLEAQLAWHQAGEPLRLLRTPIGQLSAIRDSVDLLPRDGDDELAEHRGPAGGDSARCSPAGGRAWTSGSAGA